MTEELACAAASCVCHVDAESGVHAAGQLYCSQRCADGRGCDHAGCNCGDFPAAEPPSNEALPHR